MPLRIGRSRGGLSTKIHQLGDGNGLPLVTEITPGQAGDSPMLIPMLEQLRVTRPIGRHRSRPDAVRGDKAYSSRDPPASAWPGIKAVVPEPHDQQGAPRTTRISRRQTRRTRCRRLPEPQRDRAPVLLHQAVARTRHEIRQARDRLPRRRPHPRHHRLDQDIARHAIVLHRDLHDVTRLRGQTPAAGTAATRSQ